MITQSVRNVEFTGRITAIAPFADPMTRVFNIELTVPNSDDQLKPGMIASVRLDDLTKEAADRETEISIPLSAIVRPPGKSEGYVVYTVETTDDGHIAKLKTVELGNFHGRDVSVISGVEKGEQVIITGATLVTDGESVRVIP